MTAMIYRKVLSWNAKNLLNGLVYGNGGLKCWSKEYTLGINTHEALLMVKEWSFVGN